MQDFSTYDLDAYKDIFQQYLVDKGHDVQIDPNINDNVGWRPHVAGKSANSNIAVEIRFDSEIPTALNFASIARDLPTWRISFGLVDDVKVAHELVEYCVTNSILLLKASRSGIAVLNDPDFPSFIKTKRKFPLSKAELNRFPEFAQQLIDAKEIYEIGKAREAVGVIARVLDESIDGFLAAGFRKKKIPLPKDTVISLDFNGKIDFLRHPNRGKKKLRPYINDREHANYMSVKWDRNVADHPKSPAEVKAVVDMADAKIRIGYECIERTMELKATL